MKSFQCISTLIGVLFCYLSFAQKEVSLTLHFQLKYEDRDLNLNEKCEIIRDSDTLRISTLKFYAGTPNASSYDYHLVDLADSNSLLYTIRSSVQRESLMLLFGIDSVTNTSGVFGGDLDPSNGMYWAWQSGYINFKLEGTSTACSGPRREFNYHLGGYMSPYNCVQTIELPTIDVDSIITININLKVFLDEVDLINNYKVMSPGKKALDMMILAKQMFRIDE